MAEDVLQKDENPCNENTTVGIILSESKRTNNENWEKYPKSIFGWFLWTIHKRRWKWIIRIATLFIVVALAVPTYFLIILRSLEVKKLDAMYWEKNIEYWERADDPVWKSALLNTWNEQEDVPKKIWDMVSRDEYPRVQIAAAAHPWVPGVLKEKLINNAVDVRVSSYGVR